MRAVWRRRGLGVGGACMGPAGVGCDAQADPAYEGEPLITIHGSVEAPLRVGTWRWGYCGSGPRSTRSTTASSATSSSRARPRAPALLRAAYRAAMTWWRSRRGANARAYAKALTPCRTSASTGTRTSSLALPSGKGRGPRGSLGVPARARPRRGRRDKPCRGWSSRSAPANALDAGVRASTSESPAPSRERVRTRGALRARRASARGGDRRRDPCRGTSWRCASRSCS